MIHSALRWLIPLAALFVLGPIAGSLTASLRAGDGGPETTLLVSAAPMRGVIVGVAVLAIAGVAGVVGGRLIGNRSGLFYGGLVLAWAAWGTGRIDAIIGRTQSASTLYTVALEGVLVGVLGVALAALIMMVPTIAQPKPAAGAGDHHHHLPPEPRGFGDKALPLAVLAALVACGVAVFLIAQDSLKGQTFAAAAIGGVFAAAAGRVASQHVSCVVFFGAFAILMAASRAAALFVHYGSAGVTRAELDNELFRLARPLPLDYLAGAFIGIPIGLSWAGSMIERHHEH